MFGRLRAWSMKYRLSERDHQIIILFLLIGVLSVSFIAVKDATYFGDEGFHIAQIEDFLHGKYEVTGSLTTIPGYHALMALASVIMGESSITFYRLVNLLLSIGSIFVFLITAQAIHPKTALTKTVQYVYMPIIFPFFFLLYTDILSLLLMLIALYAHEKKWYAWAALSCGLGVLTRQTNIVWFAFFFVAFAYEVGMLHRIFSVITFQYGKWLAHMLPTTQSQKVDSVYLTLSALIFYSGFVLFAVFMRMNGGIAIGDKGAHPFPSFHMGNIYFLLFLIGILFLPIHLFNLPKILRYLRHNRFAPTILVTFFVVGMLIFASIHGYNQGIDSVFLRNRILSYFTSTPLLKALFLLPTTLAFFSLLVTPLQKPIYYLLYPATFLYLIPSWLIEQRYYFVPLVFFLLMRTEQRKMNEWITAVYCAGLTGALYWIVATRWLFL